MAEAVELADAVSLDRIDLLDIDDLTKLLNEASATEENLQLQLDELESRMQQCIDILSSDHLTESSTYDRYSLAHSEILNQFVDSTNVISIHKLLGLECMSLTQNRWNVVVHCYENDYPSLPMKLMQFQKSPDSERFLMKPKEILFYLHLEDKLQETMRDASWPEMIQCLQIIQSFIFDLVAHQNVLSALKTYEPIKYTLFAQRNATGISFVLPTDWHSASKNNEIQTILLNNLTTILKPPSPSSDYMWTAELINHSTVNHTIPASVSSHLREFVRSLKTKNVLQCVETLMNKYRLERLTASPSMSSGTGEEFTVL